jgi:hypothetical protein
MSNKQPTSQQGVSVEITPNSWSPNATYKSDEEREYRSFTYGRSPRSGHYEIRKAPAPSRLTASMFTNEYAMQTAIDNHIKAEEAKKKNV